METNKAVKFMRSVNTVMDIIQSSLRGEEKIYNFKMVDLGEIIRFSVMRGRYDNLVDEIEKLDENSLQMIYAAIRARFGSIMDVGATTYDINDPVVFNLAPVIGEKTMIEIVSPQEKDQKWFYQELVESTKVKGH